MKYNGDISQWQFYKHLEFLDPHMVDRTQQKFERTKDGKLIVIVLFYSQNCSLIF